MTTTTTPDFTTPQPASSTSPAPENCCEKIIFQSNGGVKDFYNEALGNTQKELFLKIPALFFAYEELQSSESICITCSIQGVNDLLYCISLFI